MKEGGRRYACGGRGDGMLEGGGRGRRLRAAGWRQPPDLRRLRDGGIRHILVRHEAGGGHAAQGYAKATGKVGVAFATSGPGATNLITPICDAMMDSVPVVFITGQVRTELLGTDGFQEADTLGITIPIVKHSFMIQDPQRDPAGDPRGVLHRAQRPSGPGAGRHPAWTSHAAEIDYEPVTDVRLPGYQPTDRRQPEADPPGCQGAGGGAAPGDLRRRRRGQRERLGGARRVRHAATVFR